MSLRAHTWHRLGGLTMWSAVGLAAASVLFLLPRAPEGGFAVFLASVLLVGIGATVRKRPVWLDSIALPALDEPVRIVPSDGGK